jgi:hypothetical protein
LKSEVAAGYFRKFVDSALNKYERKIWTGFGWLRMEASGRIKCPP